MTRVVIVVIVVTEAVITRITIIGDPIADPDLDLAVLELSVELDPTHSIAEVNFHLTGRGHLDLGRPPVNRVNGDNR
jgi:hypothetical protein